jgi:hypothetical protein
MPDQANTQASPARIAGDVLYLDGFEERDPEVVNIVAASDDAESAVHRIQQVGARALGLAQTSIDTHVVKGEFEEMSREFAQKLGETLEQMSTVTAGLLDEETGELARALKHHAGELREQLGATFDEDNKQSALAKMDRVFDDAAKEQVDAVKRVVDPDDPASPLARHRQQIEKTIKDVGENLSKALAELSEKVAVGAVRAEMAERTASKGFAFEDMVHKAVSRVAASHGDIAEKVSSVAGVNGVLAGDEVVTLCLDDTRGASARYTLELKDRKLGQKATFEELDRAMRNRDALVGIAVFSRQEHAPIAGPFAFWGQYAIVVLDKDSVEDGPLRLACLWARWMVRRRLSDDGTHGCLDRVAGLIDDARRALDRVTTVRRCHTSAGKRLSEASIQVDEMAAEVEIALDAIAAEISR